MSQFTNNWNAQNGAMAGMSPMGETTGMPMGMRNISQEPIGGNAMANWQYNQQAQAMSNQSNPNMRGWKTYTPDPPSPPVRMTDGYWVDAFENIKPKDVPMDGEMHFFPQTDNSCVYAKVWTNDGQLLSFRFLPEKVEQPKQDVPQDINGFLKGYEIVTERQTERLEGLEKKLDRLYNAIMGDDTKEGNVT